MTTIADLLHTSRKHTRTDPRDAEHLLAHVLGCSREDLLAHPEKPVQPPRAARYRRLLRRRMRGEPLPYLLKEAWFYGRPFTVNRHVLIPRPETELLVELAIANIQKYRIPNTEYRILDIGTGSGCIAVTIAAELPRARVMATDSSPTALRVARANASRHGVANRITFLRGNLLQPILNNCPTPSRSPSRREGEKRNMSQFCIFPSAFFLLANLPYLTTAEWCALPRSLRSYEPRQAFDGGPDGLAPFRALFNQLKSFIIHHSSFIILELDPRRKRALTALIRTTLPGWRASWHKDLAGRWRILTLRPASFA